METGEEPVLHVHFMKRHLPLGVSIASLLALAITVSLITFYYVKEESNINKIYLKNVENKIEFTYGSWPALGNADFFENVKSDLMSQGTSFIEANLTTLTLRIYNEGLLESEVPIISKGREGSWWETPAGLYNVSTKEENHFSSFGQVYMPWSMQFQGNFFIHGWPYHPDGTPVADGFSGGCIRLNSEDAEQIFNLANTNIPVLIFKESFNASTDGTTYEKQKVVLGNASYLAADIENNFVFAENKLGEERSIASIVKLLTALVAVEYINVERIANVDDSMEIETSIPRIESGDSYTVLDLLSILLMESSNRAALAIADVLGEARFVRLMNDKVDAIGMKDTRVADTSGVLGSNVSTPEDLFMLLKYLYHNRSFVLDMSVGKERRAVYGPSDFGNVASLNEIPGTVGIIGGKSGKSTSAKDSMVSVFEMKIGNKNRPVAIIVLGSDDSKRDVKLIYDHIRDNFEITSN